MGRGGGEHKSSPRREQPHKTPHHTGKGFAEGCAGTISSRRIAPPFLRDTQVSLYIIPAPLEIRFYRTKKKEKNPLAGLKQKKDPPGERGHGEQGAQVRLSRGGARPGRGAANGLRQQELMPMLKSSPVLFLLPAARFARPCPAASGAESTWGKARRGAKGAQMPLSVATWLACGVSQSLGKEHG